MTELKRIHISEIATLYAVQDKPDAYYYDATEAEKVIAEKDKELHDTKRALWLARADRALIALEYFTLNCRWFKDYMKIEPPQCNVAMIKKWACVNRKCRAYADKFKDE